MDCLSPNSTPQKVVFMKGAQIGGTEAGLNWLSYIIHYAPGPTMLVNPTLDAAKNTSKTRLMPMIEKTRVLRKSIIAPNSRDTGNTIMHKAFKGGFLLLVGANTPTGLRSASIRYLMLDEVDNFPRDTGNEGDPVDLAVQRTATHRNKKIFMVSTPIDKGTSRIEAAFLEGDQRYYHVPCPKCGHYQRLVFANLRFDSKNFTEACYECQKCKEHWHDWQKDSILRRGHWVAEKPFSNGGASFHLSSLYSPHGWLSWTELVREFLEVRKDPVRLKVWVNTKLGESWEDQGEGNIDPTSLMLRREHFGSDLPSGVVVLTAGVDVQDNRLEIEIVGWGRNEESWSIDYLVLYGDPSGTALWTQLDEVLMRRWRHSREVEDKRIYACCIDSGGHYTDHVINYCTPRIQNGVFAIKGDGGQGKPVWPATASQSFRTKKPVYVIGVNDAKDTIMRRLHNANCDGCWHFPHEREIEWFEQITNEVARQRFKSGVLLREWRPRKDGLRVEALDCRVYAYAALRALVRRYSLNINTEADNIAEAPMRPKTQNAPTPAQSESQQQEETEPPMRRVRSKGIQI